MSLPSADPPVKSLGDLSEQALSELKQHLAGDPIDAKRIQGLSSGALTGRIAADGTTTAGTGFTSANTSGGNYSITFNTPYSVAPTVVASGANSSAGVTNVASVSTTGFTIAITGGVNRPFNFAVFATV